jgi:hypothetical protein
MPLRCAVLHSVLVMSRNRDPAPFCDVISQPSNGSMSLTCDRTRNYPAMCNLKRRSTKMPPEYRYFNTTVANGQPEDNPAYYGGNVEYADYCPYLQQVRDHSPNAPAYRFKRCKDSSLQLPNELNPLFETYNENSICLRHASNFITYFDDVDAVIGNRSAIWGSGCYEVQTLHYICTLAYFPLVPSHHKYIGPV